MRAEDSAVPVRRLVALAGQLALVVLLIRYFQIGDRPFRYISYLALAGFVVNALLPYRFRLHFFLALSVAGIAIIAGPVDAGWLLLIVAGFVGLCFVPIGFWGRAGLLAGGGGALAYLRTNGVVPWSEPLWPILASILMFRLIVFLYDTYHERRRPPLAWTFSYFLLLPNVSFPLFPVVDFERFRSTYYSEPAERIYRRGIGWMLRGVSQLVLYRIVYQYFTVSPIEVSTTLGLLQYVLSSYGLYLRVSGLFHLIVGMLLLFGFNLPETHHRYFFASSFTDFWRRINIYWKDFMVKLFYNPTYFRLKRRSPTVAVVGATIIVFVLTWLLHSYQWYWLRGTALFAVHDMLFWTVLGLAVVLNSLWEMKRGRERVLGEVPLFSYRWTARAGRVLAMFTTMAILWSMWTADSLMQWLTMWRLAGPTAVAIPAVIPLALLVGSYAARRARAPRRIRRATPGAESAWTRRRPVFGQVVAIGILCFMILSERTRVGGGGLPETIESIRTDRLNRRDRLQEERGYYEHLVSVNTGGRIGLVDTPATPRDWVNIWQSGLLRPRADFLLTELRPNLDTTYQRARLRTNQWGMRDKDYSLEKPENTVRIAVVGSSHAMGPGVDPGEPFADILEEGLNAQAWGTSYEILNFAVSGLSSINHVYILDAKVETFKPDIVIYVLHDDMERFVARHLFDVVRSGVDVPFPYLRELITGLGLERAPSPDVVAHLLTPRENELEAWAEQGMADAIRRMGARPIAAYLPRVGRVSSDDRLEKIMHRLASEGFDTINLATVYAGHRPEDLRVAPWDGHPSPFAHRLIAERLLEELGRRPELLAAPVEPEQGMHRDAVVGRGQ